MQSELLRNVALSCSYIDDLRRSALVVVPMATHKSGLDSFLPLPISWVSRVLRLQRATRLFIAALASWQQQQQQPYGGYELAKPVPSNRTNTHTFSRPHQHQETLHSLYSPVRFPHKFEAVEVIGCGALFYGSSQSCILCNGEFVCLGI